jgi:hypothetical protein
MKNLLKEKLKNVGTLLISDLPTYVDIYFNHKQFDHEAQMCSLKILVVLAMALILFVCHAYA